MRSGVDRNKAGPPPVHQVPETVSWRRHLGEHRVAQSELVSSLCPSELRCSQVDVQLEAMDATTQHPPTATLSLISSQPGLVGPVPAVTNQLGKRLMPNPKRRSMQTNRSLVARQLASPFIVLREDTVQSIARWASSRGCVGEQKYGARMWNL